MDKISSEVGKCWRRTTYNLHFCGKKDLNTGSSYKTTQVGKNRCESQEQLSAAGPGVCEAGQVGGKG